MEYQIPGWLTIITLALLVTVAVLVLWLRQLSNRLNTAMGGSASKLEETLASYFSHVRGTDKKLDALTTAYTELAAMTGLASQKISVVRFNPFGDTGGDQSFVLAVLDAHNSGYILTSIHGREGTRIYVKPIDFGKSKYTLSNEEQQALTQAAKRVPKPRPASRTKREELNG